MSGEQELEVKRMMQKFGHQISVMNSQQISDIAGDISQEDFLNLANAISILRAKYLKGVLQIARVEEDRLTINLCLETRKARIAYEEALESFEQLKHALQRGYFNLVDQ